MTSEPHLPDLKQCGAVAELQAGAFAFRSRTDASVIAAVGAMVIGILLAVAAIIGAARSSR